MVVSKDRTNELNQIFEDLKRSQPHRPPPPAQTPQQQTSQFYLAAQEVTKELTGTSEMLENLTKLIRQKDVFDDHSAEIQQMTMMVKERIANLHNQLGVLSQIKDQGKHWRAHQADEHSTKVVNTLRSKLLNTTKSFKEILQSRTKTMKAANDRRAPITSDSTAQFASSLFRHADDEDVDFGFESQQMQLVQNRHSQEYFRQRQEGVRQIERVVAELGDMFVEFNRLIQEQEEMVQRIDTNTEMALLDVERGQAELVKYFNRISSNRGLILKIFGVLFVFVIVFGLFVIK